MEPADRANALGRELAYYKRRLDELAGESLKLDYQISGLRKEVNQKRQAFRLLSRLQQAVGQDRDLSATFELVIREVNAALGMDRTIVLTPTEREDHYRPSRWTGFTEQGRSAEFERRMAETTIVFPREFSEGTGRLLVNRQTPPSTLVDTLRDTFELPFFVSVPVLVERTPVGILLSGRIKEAGTVFPPLDQGDVETIQAIAALIAVSVESMRIGVLKETDRLKTEFFANISHEFRTPITLTLGPLEQWLAGRYGELSREGREQVVLMQRSQERLLGLVNQILDLAKLEAGRALLHAARTPHVNALVERRTAEFRPAAARRGIEVGLVLDPALEGADLYVDGEKLDRLLVNLLSNALKFTREGRIDVATWVRDGAFWLQVADTGIGIKEDQLPYIFDRFRQADGSESREFSGTGIGLALVEEITRAHGGDVSVSSQFGKGTSLRVRLPLGRDHLAEDQIVEAEGADSVAPIRSGTFEEAAEPRDAERMNREAEATFDAERETVLCAEDHPDLRRHLRDLLSPTYNVFVAADGHEALRVARRYQPGIIVTDQMMPNLSGRDLLTAIRGDEALSAIPVVFLTARAGTEARIESLQAGADDYITKPFHEAELRARVANLLRSRAQERQLAALNRRLEARVEEQLAELVRTGGLKHFLPQRVVDGVLDGRLAAHGALERRKVTALFVDLAGFDELTGAVEPEDLASVAGDFTRETSAAAVELGGTVANVTAQSGIVLFDDGAAPGTEEHALSAARCAVGIRDRLEALRAGWRRRGIAGPLAVRAGIDTGYCTVGVFGSEHLRSYTAVGAPMKVGRALQAAARAGQILCGSATFALVEGRAAARPCGSIPIEGASRPVDAYEIEAVIGPDSADAVAPHRAVVPGDRALAAGARIGHYQVLARIGSGGMGEVYRAKDTRLDRPVALKVLSPHVAHDPELRERLRREARAAAALRHPNVVNVYSFEESGGRHFITMELVEGETLTDLIPGSGMELSRMVDFGLQLVDAVASAHAHGVIHRDLKPANVMVEGGSRLKVLDFGLAKLARSATHSAETATDVATRPGAVLGTVPYMSPEQVQGRPTDHRSDIFSLGVILYEMATGRRPFEGGTSAEIAAAILRDQPIPLCARRPDLPESLARIVGRCLAKNREDRYADARALHRELELLR